MGRGGKRPGAGRPKIVFTEDEEMFIASKYYQRRREIGIERHWKNVEHAMRKKSPRHYDAMTDAQADLRALRSPGRTRQSAQYQERLGDAKAERKMYFDGLKNNGRAEIGNPRLSQDPDNRIAKETADFCTEHLGKKVSPTRVKDFWKKHSAMFLDPTQTDPDV